MAYDSVRAQLDKLLGPDRNGPLTAPSSAPISYTGPAICKHFLLGFCPHDLSIKHRSEPGSCPRQHDLPARSAFEADRHAGKIPDLVSRWTRALLVDCRAILADEERKIRGHARRLQETYEAKGDLGGFMIRNFDTLKALGMVSQDAKIRVLSEMDDDQVILATDLPASSETQDREKGKQPSQPAENSEAINRKDASGAKDVITSAGLSMENGNASDDDDDDDDDFGGFGVIKVIPARTGDQKMHDGETGVKPAAKAEDTKASDEEINVMGKTVGREFLYRSEGEDASAVDRASVRDDKDGTAKGKVLPSPSSGIKKNDENHDLKTGLISGGDKDAEDCEEPGELIEDKMEEYYRRGIGPDGLLMLNRKQSLRVCAGCGGYISLVDAESRLLSHYGGKSHQSLVQLREKVSELERVVASEKRPAHDIPRDTYARNGREDRHFDRPRRDERGSRTWDRQRRHGGGNEGHGDYRGHNGTADWYHSQYRGLGERDRRSDENPYDRHSRYRGRHESGRKRYRSRSPTRNDRRQRYRR